MIGSEVPLKGVEVNQPPPMLNFELALVMARRRWDSARGVSEVEWIRVRLYGFGARCKEGCIPGELLGRGKGALAVSRGEEGSVGQRVLERLVVEE